MALDSLRQTKPSYLRNYRETAQVLELKELLNKDGMNRSISVKIRWLTTHSGLLWLTLKRSAPNADFRDKGDQDSLVIPLKELFKLVITY